MAGYNILNIVYGMEIQEENDPFIALVEEAVHILSKFGNAGQYLGMIFAYE